LVISAPMRLAMCCSIAWSNALSSVAMTAQLGLSRQAAFFTGAAKTAMLTGTCEALRKAASASLVSAAKPALNFSRLTKPYPSSPMSMTKSGVGANPPYCWALVSPASGASADT
jgi:hypothetical protein